MTETNLALARSLWDDGLSARLIARQLGISKNCIISYARRHDWPGRPSPLLPSPLSSRLPAAVAAVTLYRDGVLIREIRRKLGLKKDKLERIIRKSGVPRRQPREPRYAPMPAPAAAPAPPSPPVAAVTQPAPVYRQCQWIEGGRPWRMCGCPTVQHGAWCAAHRRIVYHARPRWEMAA